MVSKGPSCTRPEATYGDKKKKTNKETRRPGADETRTREERKQMEQEDVEKGMTVMITGGVGAGHSAKVVEKGEYNTLAGTKTPLCIIVRLGTEENGCNLGKLAADIEPFNTQEKRVGKDAVG